MEIRTALRAGCLLVSIAALTGAAAPSHSIEPDAVRAHVAVLAGDAMEGRGAGYPGEERAAEYIAAQFRAIGLETTIPTFPFLPRAPEAGRDTMTSRDVLGLLAGADQDVADEVIVLGAHHDGQGRAGQADGGRLPADAKERQDDVIWNSADDNASSVAAIIEIARALAKAEPRPRRSILFATFGAEEHSLEGSAWLAAHGVPGRRLVAMINVEKTGRVPDKPLIVAGCSTSRDWKAIAKEAAAAAGVPKVECVLPELVPDTDHYPFAAAGIPAIVLGTVHEEDTHQPTDETALIDAPALARRARLIASFVQTLAARDRLPRFASGVERGAGLIAVEASPRERTTLGLGGEGALKVTVVFAGLPAAKTGLLAGDFVTAIDGVPVTAKPEERAIHDALIKNGSVRLAVRRGGDTRAVTLTESFSAPEGGVSAPVPGPVSQPQPSSPRRASRLGTS
jgi:acetylornithine deacetylase/succinyl-diaminopimelate desuccinylase-like protein